MAEEEKKTATATAPTPAFESTAGVFGSAEKAEKPAEEETEKDVGEDKEEEKDSGEVKVPTKSPEEVEKEEEAEAAPAGPTPEQIALQEQLAALQVEYESLQDLSNELIMEIQELTGDPYIPIRDARYVPDVGKYMEPVNQTLNAHFQLIFDRSNKLDFWPQDNPTFDAIISDIIPHRAFHSPDMEDTSVDPRVREERMKVYFDYEPLRDNISTVRNYLLNCFVDEVPEGSPQMDQAILKMEQMAREIGVSIHRDVLNMPGPNTTTLDIDALMVPGSGAAEIYKFLVEKQNRPMWRHPIDKLRGRDYKHWNLPPVEQSPFSQENVDYFCINYTPPNVDPDYPEGILPALDGSGTNITPQQPAIAQQPEAPDAQSDAIAQAAAIGRSLAVSANNATTAARSLQKVEALPRPIKNEAVQLARDILDKLKITFCNDTAQEWLQHPNEHKQQAAESIGLALTLYDITFNNAVSENPDLAQAPELLVANEAAGKLAYLTKLQAQGVLEQTGYASEAALIQAELDAMPDNWKQFAQDEKIGDLVAKISDAVEITHKASMKAQAQHMLDLQQQQQQQAQQGGTQKAAEPAVTQAQAQEKALQQALQQGFQPDELDQIKSSIGTLVAETGKGPQPSQQRGSRGKRAAQAAERSGSHSEQVVAQQGEGRPAIPDPKARNNGGYAGAHQRKQRGNGHGHGASH